MGGWAEAGADESGDNCAGVNLPGGDSLPDTLLSGSWWEARGRTDIQTHRYPPPPTPTHRQGRKLGKGEESHLCWAYAAAADC